MMADLFIAQDKFDYSCKQPRTAASSDCCTTYTSTTYGFLGGSYCFMRVKACQHRALPTCTHVLLHTAYLQSLELSVTTKTTNFASSGFASRHMIATVQPIAPSSLPRCRMFCCGHIPKTLCMPWMNPQQSLSERLALHNNAHK